MGLCICTPVTLLQVRVAAYGQHGHGHGHREANKYKDSRALRQLKEKQNKHILSTYNKAYAFFPKVGAGRSKCVALFTRCTGLVCGSEI